jgi:hypothetical protein
MAELHAAFYWDCEKCGRENFIRAISGVLHMTPLLQKMLADQHLVIQPDPLESDTDVAHLHYRAQKIVLAPPTVACPFCGHHDLAAIEDLETKIPNPPTVVESDYGNLDPAFADAATSDPDWDDDDDDLEDDDWEDDDADEEDVDWDEAELEDAIDELAEDDFKDAGIEGSTGRGNAYDWMFSTPFDDDEDDD